MEKFDIPSTLDGRDFPLGVPGFRYQDLHREERLADLDSAFLAALAAEDPALADRLAAYRREPAAFDPLSRSKLLVDAARPLGRFVAALFGIEREWQAQIEVARPEAVLFRFRRDFLQRRALKAALPDLSGAAGEALARTGRTIERDLHPELPWDSDPEIATARLGAGLLDLETDFLAAIRQKKISEVPGPSRERAAALALRAAGLKAGADVALPALEGGSGDEGLLRFVEALLQAYAPWIRARLSRPDLFGEEVRHWASFKVPEPLDYSSLVATERPNLALPE
ncbi:MAG: hypothetical protein M3R34_07520, partial [Acidobacteriota bacterium]|nr:hypothetical protein [Acidobacteriota bacterium]